MNRFFRLYSIAALASTLLAASAFAQPSWDHKNSARNQFILRGSHAEIAAIAERHGLEVVRQLNGGDETNGVALVRGSTMLTEEQVRELVTPDEEVLGLEPVGLAILPEAQLEQSSTPIVEQSSTPIVEQSSTPIVEAVQSAGAYEGAEAAFFSTPVWSGFANQPAAQTIRLTEARGNGNGNFGSGVVAIIDTGIDPDHPLLAGALVPGYDFVADAPGIPSEWSNLDTTTAAELQQSSTPIVESSSTALMGGSGELFSQGVATALLEQSASELMQQYELPAAFGHGTMVAGVVRLVAPGAQIMPLRAFDADGTGSIFDIVRAIYFAVENGANVINMSFSVEEFSPELARAVNFAHRNGVICVAAAGNRAERVLTYPSAFGNAVGVASTDYGDELSSFSNFGSDLVTLAAPGEGLITAFPGGFYAAAWGTSFATPLVAGTMALLHDTTGNGSLKSAADFYEALYALAKGATFLPQLSAELGNGRLDVAESLANRMQVVN